jgi:hypothetical protein
MRRSLADRIFILENLCDKDCKCEDLPYIQCCEYKGLPKCITSTARQVLNEIGPIIDQALKEIETNEEMK